MAMQWYYGRGSDISGPVSEAQLSSLVASGQVLRTDTVWQDDVEQGVAAGTVKSLFESLPQREVMEEKSIPNVIGLSPEGSWIDPTAPVEQPLVADEPAVPAPPLVAPMPKPANRGRATAGKGVIIVGQDGKTVKFRLKCTVCGLEDSSWKTIAIPRGTARASFYCRKCRKTRDGEINGII